jgi:hypothetical protein
VRSSALPPATAPAEPLPLPLPPAPAGAKALMAPARALQRGVRCCERSSEQRAASSGAL